MKRRTHDEFETRHVAPAPPGWRAVYADENTDGDSVEPYCFDPVVAFGEIWRKTWVCDERGAHVDVERGWRRDGWEALVLDCETGTLDRASEVGNFIGLVRPGEDPTDVPWLAVARDAHLDRERTKAARS